MKIDIIPAYDRKEDILALFSEYTDMLTDADPTVSECLKVQNYDEEILDLDKKYGEPFGRLYLALCDGNAAGCAALRRLDDENCEMKRLYVRPQYRGNGLGEMLAKKLITDAKHIGYSRMYLDTLPFLDSAIRLYERMGFCRTERYNDSPAADTIFMKYEIRHIC